PRHALAAQFIRPKLRLLLPALFVYWEEYLIKLCGGLRSRNQDGVVDLMGRKCSKTVHKCNDRCDLGRALTSETAKFREFVGSRRILPHELMTLQIDQRGEEVGSAPLPPRMGLLRLKCAKARFQELDDLFARDPLARCAPSGDQHPNDKRARVCRL